MYLSVGVVLMIAAVVLSPVIWIAWWTLAEMSARATGSYHATHHLRRAL